MKTQKLGILLCTLFVLVSAEFTDTTVGYLIKVLGETDAIAALELAGAKLDTTSTPGTILLRHEGIQTSVPIDHTRALDSEVIKLLEILVDKGMGAMFEASQEFEDISLWEGTYCGPRIVRESPEVNVVVQLQPFYEHMTAIFNLENESIVSNNHGYTADRLISYLSSSSLWPMTILAFTVGWLAHVVSQRFITRRTQ